MKKLLLILILSGLYTTGKSQSLLFTEWFGTNPPSMNLYFYFGIDTVYYSTGSGYIALSLYSESGGQITIADINGTAACTDTGTYNFSIASNTLSFSLISDLCVSRTSTLTNYNWNQINTGISGISPVISLAVFPNPSNDGRFSLSLSAFEGGKHEILFSDISGRVVYRKRLETPIQQIDIGFLPKGIYNGQYYSDQGICQFRVVR